MSSENYLIQSIEDRQIVLKRLRDDAIIENVIRGIVPCHDLVIIGRSKPTWRCAYNDNCRFQKLIKDQSLDWPSW